MMEPVAYVTVRVEDTCDGLLINADDMKRFGLQYDYQYEGKFLPDGRYQIAVPSLPTARKAEPSPARLSDAEARIKELEVENACLKAQREEADHKLVDRYRDPKTGTFSFPGDVAAIVRRLDAAEALLKEAGEALDGMLQYAGIIEERCGNVETVLARRAARAIHHKIGVKDE